MKHETIYVPKVTKVTVTSNNKVGSYIFSYFSVTIRYIYRGYFKKLLGYKFYINILL